MSCGSMSVSLGVLLQIRIIVELFNEFLLPRHRVQDMIFISALLPGTKTITKNIQDVPVFCEGFETALREWTS